MIITLDGPAGSGKSTVAARLARSLSMTYLDTGAMYRALTWAARKEDVSFDDEQALVDLARRSAICFTREHPARVLVNDIDVTETIRCPEITNLAHYIASRPALREILVEQQRAIARTSPEIVTEGRDQGTVVFPRAACKFFLDASTLTRAQRRFDELTNKGTCTSLSEVLRDLHLRDQRDRARQVGPLKPAPEAIRIDTTDMSIETVVQTLAHYVQKAREMARQTRPRPADQDVPPQ